MGNLVKKLIHIIKVVISGKQLTEENKANNLNIRFITCITMTVVSLVLTIINIITKQSTMMWMTIALFISFGFCSLLIKLFKQPFVAEIITSITVGVVFSYFAISGDNEGFAILWILLIPAVSSLFLSYRLSLILSTYFLLFLLVIFYTPLKQYIPGMEYYYHQFQIRFPVLYLSSFALCMILSTQSIYFSIISQRNSLYDFMTDLKNRRFCGDYMDKYKDQPLDKEFTCLSLDINNLKTLNDVYGHDIGDKAIIATATVLKKVFKGVTDNLYRMGGDEYTVFYDDNENEVEETIAKIKELAAKENLTKDVYLSVSIGYVKSREYIQDDIPTLMKIAENNMYKDKEAYYLANNVDRRRKSAPRIGDVEFIKKD